MSTKIKTYQGSDLINLKSNELQIIDVEHTYLCWPIDIEGSDCNDLKRVKKAIKLSDFINLIIK